MKGDDTTERVRTKSQKRNEVNGNDEMEWNESIGMEMDRSECD